MRRSAAQCSSPPRARSPLTRTFPPLHLRALSRALSLSLSLSLSRSQRFLSPSAYAALLGPLGPGGLNLLRGGSGSPDKAGAGDRAGAAEGPSREEQDEALMDLGSDLADELGFAGVARFAPRPPMPAPAPSAAAAAASRRGAAKAAASDAPPAAAAEAPQDALAHTTSRDFLDVD